MSKEKVDLPVEISNEMYLWRHGIGEGGFPISYIQFHLGLAESELERLKAEGLEVLSEEMKRGGWGDGMKELNVRAIHKTIRGEERVVYLHWHDSNQEFFVKHSSGGSFPFRLGEA